MWKFKKNVSSDQMKHITRIQRKRKAEEGKETRFTSRGRPVPAENIERWQKRQKSNGHDIFQESSASRMYKSLLCSSFTDIFSQSLSLLPRIYPTKPPSEAASTPSQHDAPTPQALVQDLETSIDNPVPPTLLNLEHLWPGDDLAAFNLSMLYMTSMSTMLPDAFGHDPGAPEIHQADYPIKGSGDSPGSASREQTPTQESYESTHTHGCRH